MQFRVLLAPLLLRQWPLCFPWGRQLFLTQRPASLLEWPSVGAVVLVHALGISRCWGTVLCLLAGMPICWLLVGRTVSGWLVSDHREAIRGCSARPVPDALVGPFWPVLFVTAVYVAAAPW